MANAKPNSMTPQAPKADPSGPVIEYVGEGAEKVKFTINPKAAKYVVHADGMILETFQ